MYVYIYIDIYIVYDNLYEYHFESNGILLEIKSGQERSMETFLQKRSMKLMNFPNSCFKPLDAEGEKFRPHKLWDKSMAVWLILPRDLHI